MPPLSGGIAMNDSGLSLYPELNSMIASRTSRAWLLSQATTAAWLQQREAMLPNAMFQQQMLLPSPEKKEKVSFSIDNIMTGRYEEASRQSRRSVETPSSPTSSSSEAGLKYECEVCGKTYSTFSGFTKHKQFYCMPQSKKQFNCKHCDKTYYSLGALKMHIRTHTLPCKCKVCGKAFSRPWLLQGHMRTHTGEKPFKCQHCGRAFADRSNLRAHLQTHSDIKKYSCKQCDKTFSRMSLLLKHEESACMTSMAPMFP